MYKPKVLYHASVLNGLEVIEPREDSGRLPGEGPLVFATPDKRVAAMFLAPRGIGEQSMNVFGDEPVMVIHGDQGSYAQVDQGGTVYEVPVDTFRTDTTVGMGEIEWVSEVPVVPKSQRTFRSSLDAMHAARVKVYFVDKTTFEAIQEAADHGYEILQTLEPVKRFE